jgi:hypothetical protein
MLPVPVILMPIAQQNHLNDLDSFTLEKDGRLLAGASSVVRLHPTKALSVVVLDHLASLPGFPPPSP